MIRVSDGRVMRRVSLPFGTEPHRLVPLNGTDGLAVLSGWFYRVSMADF